MNSIGANITCDKDPGLAINTLLSKFNTKANLTSGDSLSFDNICQISEIKNQFSFGTLWKSGMISMVSLGLAQLKANNIQHELTTGTKQKVLYLLSSILNALSYSALLILFSINIFHIYSLILDKMHYVYKLLFMENMLFLAR